MFRSMRFCYFLTNNFHKLNGVYSKNALLNVSRVVSTPPTTCTTRQVEMDYPFEVMEEISNTNEFKTTTFTRRYWESCLTEDTSDVDWDKYLTSKEMPKERWVNVYATIFLLCQDKGFHNCAISLFNYLWEKEELTAGLLFLFCNIILGNPKNFECCQDLIFNIFQNVLNTDKISARMCSRVLLHMPKYSNFVYEFYVSHMSNFKCHNGMVLSLIKTNKMNEALELYKKSQQRLFSVEESFLDACYLQIIEGNATLSDMYKLINDLFNIEYESVASNEYLNALKILFQKLESVDKDYTWNIRQKKLNSSSCPLCNRTLKYADVTEKEIEILLKDLEANVIVQDSIYLKSNHKEWKTFCDFIKTQDYDLVMDGLNVKYKTNSYEKFFGIVKQVTNKGFTPLILGKSYFTKFPEYNLIKNQFPTFLTDPLSDDDVFVLYAALKKGKSCYFLSNDKMRFCRYYLTTQETLKIYTRWKAIRQCNVNVQKGVIFPSMIENKLYKDENCQDGEFSYHFVHNDDFGQFITCISRLKKGSRKEEMKFSDPFEVIQDSKSEIEKLI